MPLKKWRNNGWLQPLMLYCNLLCNYICQKCHVKQKPCCISVPKSVCVRECVWRRAGDPVHTHRSRARPWEQPWGRSFPGEGSCTWADNTRGTSSQDGCGDSWWSRCALQERSHPLWSPPSPQTPTPTKTTEKRDRMWAKEKDGWKEELQEGNNNPLFVAFLTLSRLNSALFYSVFKN